MVEALLALIPGGNGLVVGIIGVLGALAAAYFKGRSAERINQKAKEADSYERHLKDIADAADARNGILPTDSVSNDKYRRD